MTLENRILLLAAEAAVAAARFSNFNLRMNGQPVYVDRPGKIPERALEIPVEISYADITSDLMDLRVTPTVNGKVIVLPDGEPVVDGDFSDLGKQRHAFVNAAS